MGLIQFTSLMIASFATIPNPNVIAVVLMFLSLSGAFIDVVMDAMMVIEAKKNPEQGSQELLSLAWMVAGVAAIVGGIAGAVIL
jgi:integral membrane sensor domain MASE1